MTVRLEVDGPVAVITLDRPEALNALDREAYRQLTEAWTRVRDDRDIWAAVVTGAGERAFCVGADLNEDDPRDEPWHFWQTQNDLLLNRGLEVWKPVVAAVNGYCLGGGMTLLLATDIRGARETATFGVSEVTVGLVPGNGGTQRLLGQVPYAIGMEMLLLGQRLSAEEARGYGLVNRVTAPGNVLPMALEIARELCKRAPLAVRAAKELAVRSRNLPLSDGLRLEQAILRVLRSTSDAAEGKRAFQGRRTPNFEGH